jgi:hypothetical protein
MIRALVIVAVAGLVTSIVCISAAIAIGGPAVLAHGTWGWGWQDWEGGHHHMWRHMHEASGPQAQRDFPWTGDRLEIDAPADITYVQAAGPAKLVVQGPQEALNQLQVQDGRVTLNDDAHLWETLHVTLTAPAVSRFDLHGADRLHITGYRQDQLTIAVSGHGDVAAQGETKAVNLTMAGSGDADFSGLETAGADIDISGAGAATVGPTDWARVQISGVGDVNLLTKPPKLETHIAGAGVVRQPGQSRAAVGSSGDDDQSDDDARGPKRPT